jgi:hypothetical protein
MSKKQRIWLILFVVITAAFSVLLVWGDEDLEPEVQAVLRTPDRLPADQNLFNALTGFTVAADKIPYEEGFAAVTRANELLARYGLGDDEQRLQDELAQAWFEDVFALEDAEELLCGPQQADCLDRLWTPTAAMEQLAAKYQLLVTRYLELTRYPAHQSEVRPHVQAPLPNYRSIIRAHRLWIAHWIAGDPSNSPALFNDLIFLRRFLAQSDTILAKMVASALIAETLYAYAALMDRDGAVIAGFPAIESLKAADQALDSPLRSEFRFSAAIFLDVSNDPRAFQELGIPSWMGETAMRPLFKPHRSMNRAYRCTQQMLAVTQLSSPDFIEVWSPQEAPRCKLSWIEYLINPIGSILLDVAQPDFGRYAARLHDLNGLITLVNAKRAIRNAGISSADVAEFLRNHKERFTGPYHGDALHWQPETGNLSFTSPVPIVGYQQLPLGFTK